MHSLYYGLRLKKDRLPSVIRESLDELGFERTYEPADCRFYFPRQQPAEEGKEMLAWYGEHQPCAVFGIDEWRCLDRKQSVWRTLCERYGSEEAGTLVPRCWGFGEVLRAVTCGS